MHVSSSTKYWDNINELFYKKYKGLEEKHKEWAQLVVEGQPIVGPLGRFWPIELTTDFKGNLKIPWTVLTNYPIQGTGADLMAIARVSFMNRLRKANLTGAVLISSVHDSIVVDSPSKWLPQIAQMFHEVFRDLQPNIKKLFGYDWKVPLACEVKYGPNMKEMIKYV